MIQLVILYYDKGAKITVELFKDRVKITNPGGLTSAITVAEFGSKSHSRNPLIFGLSVRIQMVEQVGSGVRRIRDHMKDALLPEPQFKTDGMFTVVLKRPEKSSGKSSSETWSTLKEQILLKPSTKIGKSALMIVELVYRNQYVTLPEMAMQIGLTERAIEKNIQKLKEQNLICRKDGGRSGYWELIIHKL